MTNIAMENGQFIVSFPINSMVISHSFLYVYQRVFIHPRVIFHMEKSQGIAGFFLLLEKASKIHGGSWRAFPAILSICCSNLYPLVMTNIAIENHHF